MMKKSFYTWSMCIGWIGGFFISSLAMANEQSSSSVKPLENLQSNQSGIADQQQKERWKKEVLKLANDYVTIIDQEEYVKSWQMGGPFFKTVFSKEKWVSDLTRTRKPLGHVISRQLLSIEFIKDPYDLLRGEFILVEYSTAFQNSPYTHEILLARLNPDDNQWYIGSYEILIGQNVTHNLNYFFKHDHASEAPIQSANDSSSLFNMNERQVSQSVSPKDSDQPDIVNLKIEATNMAGNFLKMIDEGNYAQSWEKGGRLFRETITQEDWVKSLNRHRKPLGKALNRAIINDSAVKNPYHVLKKNYILIEYETIFENAPSKFEVVILNRDKIGSWHVSSYDIYDHRVNLPE